MATQLNCSQLTRKLGAMSGKSDMSQVLLLTCSTYHMHAAPVLRLNHCTLINAGLSWCRSEVIAGLNVCFTSLYKARNKERYGHMQS